MVTLALPSSRKQKCEKQSPFLKKARPGRISARGKMPTSIIIIFIPHALTPNPKISPQNERRRIRIINGLSLGNNFKMLGMYQSKLATPKQQRIDERNAARALEEESQRLSDEFLRLFVGDSITHKQYPRRSAKLADWDDNLDNKINALDEKQKMVMPTRYRLKRKKMHTVESQSILDRTATKGETIDPQNRPIFSISLLNPLMEQHIRIKPSEKMRKIREKAASNLRSRFIQHITLNNEGKTGPPQTRMNIVHTINSEAYLTTSCPHNLQAQQNFVLTNDKQNRIQTRKKRNTVESESRSMQCIIRRKKKLQEMLAEKSKRKGVRQMTELADSVHSQKFNRSKEFQKLRILLSLEKI